MQFDLTRPNTGRIIDYWMGGSHNFEIDRQFADQVARQFPVLPQEAKAGRILVRRAVTAFHARGIRHLLDFGAALPTCDNTHLIAHALDPNIKVVYSDIDPITVAYGKELLAQNPNAVYLQCDAAAPRAVLDSPLTRELLGDEHRVGIVFMNLAHLLGDEPVRAAWRTLFDWAAPGSCLFLSGPTEAWNTDPDFAAVRESYRRSGITAIFRSPTRLVEMLAPWQLTEEGVVAGHNWGAADPTPAARPLGLALMAQK